MNKIAEEIVEKARIAVQLGNLPIEQASKIIASEFDITLSY